MQNTDQPSPASNDTRNDMQFSLLYFSSNEAEFSAHKYELLLEGAKFADENDFTAVWVPERHFHAFGGLYPNPAILTSALAMVTKRVRLRAGSVVLPLHNPVRVAEDWAVIDNLSQGRVDIAYATGWNPNDFVLAPNNFAARRDVMYEGIKQIQTLWRGETLRMQNGVGKEQEFRIYPQPKQQHITPWITCTGGRERFIEAGSMGANVLTALLFQSIDELADKLQAYRTARAENGFDAGHVTLMMHTFIGEDIEEVRELVRAPFIEYLRTSVDLWRQQAKSLAELTEQEQKWVLAFAFERYFETAALFGTPETCSARIQQLRDIGVNEVACLLDFGVNNTAVLQSLSSLNRLRQQFQSNAVVQA
jgi:natural product biosynthesis luciferase-like monooxygenase protein